SPPRIRSGAGARPRHRLIGRDLSIVLAAIGKPRIVLRPLVHAAARRTHGLRDHDRKLLHVGDFDAGGYRISLTSALHHAHSHETHLSIPVFGPTAPQWLVATVTPQSTHREKGGIGDLQPARQSCGKSNQPLERKN